MILDRGCWERGCACYDERVDKDGVEVIKKEWVGLTDEEIEQCFVFDWSGEFYANWRKQTYEAIKAKLKEKNT